MRGIDASIIGGRMPILGLSAGKDSTATALALEEAGVEYRAIYADTLWEHESTYEHLEYLRGVLSAPIDVVRGVGFEALVRGRRMFPTRRRLPGGRNARFCTSELKVIPITKKIAEIAGGDLDSVINPVGIRAAESRARSTLGALELNESMGVLVWRPILDWTEQDVLDIHQRHGVALHPLYREGCRRVGCWPCIMASKTELRVVARIDPERIDLIDRLECELSEGQDVPRTMFSLRPDHRTHVPASVRDVVDWAHQVRGDYLLDLGSDDWPCYRWGFCEVEQ